ncbi:hypothetical protein Lal_00037591 [Lupinus albus]|nr:hypothetical protein Lal_00037591 [Lupinus albus]
MVSFILRRDPTYPKQVPKGRRESLKRDLEVGNIQENLVEPKRNSYKPIIVVAIDNDILLIGEYNYLDVAYGDCSWIIDYDVYFHVSPHAGFFSN